MSESESVSMSEAADECHRVGAWENAAHRHRLSFSFFNIYAPNSGAEHIFSFNKLKPALSDCSKDRLSPFSRGLQLHG